MKLLFPIRKWSIHLKIIDDKIIVKAQVSIPCKFCYQWQGFFLITDILLIHLDNYNYFLSPNLLNHWKLYILTYYQLFKMISTYLFRGVRGAFQRCTPRFNMNHIKDMIEENKRAKMQEIESTPMIQTSNRVYKPSHTIQFNREGEVLLYSANPCTSETVYFKYPYILYESFIPLAILNYILNPFDMVWYWGSYSLYGSLALTIPRIWYFSDFKWMPMRLYLLRGGRVLKVEAQNLGADRFVYWLQNFLVKPLTQDKMHFDDQNQADFLTEQGQLKYDLNVEVDEFKFFGVNVNDQQLQFKTYGTVHQPQLFEAALKGYNIDTTDFVINTADNVRYREPNHNL